MHNGIASRRDAETQRERGPARADGRTNLCSSSCVLLMANGCNGVHVFLSPRRAGFNDYFWTPCRLENLTGSRDLLRDRRDGGKFLNRSAQRARRESPIGVMDNLCVLGDLLLNAWLCRWELNCPVRLRGMAFPDRTLAKRRICYRFLHAAGVLPDRPPRILLPPARTTLQSASRKVSPGIRNQLE